MMTVRGTVCRGFVVSRSTGATVVWTWSWNRYFRCSTRRWKSAPVGWSSDTGTLTGSCPTILRPRTTTTIATTATTVIACRRRTTRTTALGGHWRISSSTCWKRFGRRPARDSKSRGTRERPVVVQRRFLRPLLHNVIGKTNESPFLVSSERFAGYNISLLQIKQMEYLT